MYERIERPLNNSEVTRLRRRLATIRKRRPRYWDRWNWIGPIGCFGFIFLLGLLASAPQLVLAIVGSVLGMAIVFMATWEWWGALKGHRAYVSNLEGAIQANLASEVRIEAPAMIAFEEVEDEGLSYAYQVEPERVLFLSIGQEYQFDRRVRCDAFSLVTIGSYSAYVAKRGKALKPIRVLSAEEQKALGFGPGSRLPEGTFPGRLENIEDVLKAYASHSHSP